ncbi:DinB family protein [Chitinophaga lutea]|uniref:DinB family protein n=1 Tax=Chitinophaga lutea TaxID=2488634 RepID=A0A3N4QDI2_9BACT|nr:DinB family protein [Chitinophaga lutea]RPE09824.1 DinB family protein [Chitinophaga lutea]
MNKQAIKTLLETSFTEFSAFTDTLSDHRFVVSPEGKWSAGQQMDHLIRSAKPVNTALGMPKLFLRFFGRSVGRSRSYDQIRDTYRAVLTKGGVATRPYIPPVTEAEERVPLAQQFLLQKDKMVVLLDKWTEEELDRYQVPHPLLGKLTVREVLYFTAYHNRHHLVTLQQREELNQPWASQLERTIF